MIRLNRTQESSAVIARMEEHLGHPLSQCYQCGKCSAGCPAAYTMDEPPNRVIRFLQLGLYDRVLEQNSYWVCSSCETCTARCPRNVEVKEIMELLRHDAYRRGVTSGERPVVVFHKTFLKTVKWFGRLYEPGLIMLNNLLSGHFFKDFAAVPGMLLKGKIKLFPGRGADNAAVRRIFKYSREEAPRGEV